MQCCWLHSRGISHDLFGPLQSKATQKHYAETLTQFTTFILQAKDNYILLLPAYFFELIMELTQTKPPHSALPLILEDVLHIYALKLVEILMFV